MNDSCAPVGPAHCAERIRSANCVVALTGAGISTAAGIPDFRGPQGLYVTRRYDPERVFDILAFRRDPLPFYEFTRDFLGALDGLEPTRTHRFLARLEALGRLHAVVTQNIDGLHQLAGSRRVIAVHGDYTTSRCLACGAVCPLDQLRALVARMEVPRCDCGGVLKPDVVFFGEIVRDLDGAAAAVAASDLLLVLGSSLTVYPAAALPQLARGRVLVVNRGPVGIEALPRAELADADLDDYFGEVAERLGIDV